MKQNVTGTLKVAKTFLPLLRNKKGEFGTESFVLLFNQSINQSVKTEKIVATVKVDVLTEITRSSVLFSRTFDQHRSQSSQQ